MKRNKQLTTGPLKVLVLVPTPVSKKNKFNISEPTQLGFFIRLLPKKTKKKVISKIATLFVIFPGLSMSLAVCMWVGGI